MICREAVELLPELGCCRGRMCRACSAHYVQVQAASRSRLSCPQCRADIRAALEGVGIVAPQVVLGEAGRAALLPQPPAQDEPEPPPPPAPVRRRPGGGRFLLEGQDRREIVADMQFYELPQLNFFGVWNNQVHAPDDDMHASHFGLHWAEGVVRFQLPASLVDELVAWWSERTRDPMMDNYKLSVARVRVLIREVDLTGPEIVMCTYYAPVIAFRVAWRMQQDMARIVRGRYINNGQYFQSLVESRNTWQLPGFRAGVMWTMLGAAAGFVLFRVSVTRVRREVAVLADGNGTPNAVALIQASVGAFVAAVRMAWRVLW